MTQRRTLLKAVAATSAAVLAPWTAAHAQGDYPARTIKLLVPFGAGSTPDVFARLVSEHASKTLGQPIVIENRAGAGGNIATNLVAKAPADGYTIGMGATGAIAVNPHLPDAPPLNPRQDLLPLAKLADIPLVFVTSASSGYANLPAFLKAARETKGGLSYGTAGQHTAQHLSGELLASLSGAALEPVPYRGSGPAVTDLLGGMLPAAMVDLTSAYPHVKAGKLVALGVTSAARSKVAPEIPTIAEGGVAGYSAPAWMGLFLPAKTPPEVRAQLSAAIQKAMAKPAVQSQIQALAAEPAYMEGAAFGDFIEGESKKWAGVIARLPKQAK